MVRMLAILGFGLMMAVVSATGSWFVQNQVLAKKGDDAETAQTDEAESGSGNPDEPEPPGKLNSGPIKERMPVAVRPREMSVEELLRFGIGVREREQQVRKQEELLQQREVQQKLALADIQAERREIDGLRVQVDSQLRTAEKMIGDLQTAREAVLQERTRAEERFKSIQSARIEIDTEQVDNTKRLSLWMQGMEAEKAAEVLKEMANDGTIDTAVQILSHFEEREAAKILSAVDDPKLVQEFITRFQNLKRPVKAAANK